MSRRAAQRGQALALSLGFVLSLALAFSLVLVAGQVVFDKLRLTNAADAAALSAASWEARSLNIEAALNRAAIANEAAIAQSVSLRSWSQYVDRLLPNMNLALRFVPYLGAATQSLQRVWRGIDRATQPTLRVAERAASAIDADLAITAAGVELGAPVVARALALEAAKQSDIPARLSRGGEAALDASLLRWSAVGHRYAAAERSRQADLVQRSLDSFSRQRNHRFAVLPVGAAVRLERRGGTDLLGLDTWRAADTQSVHLRRFVLFGGWRERIPLGWGAAEAGRRSPRNGRYGDSASVNPAATRAALAALSRNPGYRGIPALRDIANAQRRADVEHRISLRLAGKSNTGRDGLLSDAAAVVRYKRPERRRDGATERPSFFEPYWEARLAPGSAIERLAADRLDGIALAKRGAP